MDTCCIHFKRFTIGQLNSLVVQNCEVPEPYGKYRLQFKFVPETIFYVTNEKSNYTSDMSLTRKGLVCPILGWREAGTTLFCMYSL